MNQVVISLTYLFYPLKTLLTQALIKLSVALVGATDITLEVGTGTDDDTLIASFDVDGNNGATVYNTGTDFVQSAGTTTVEAGAAPVAGSGGAAATNLIYKFGGTVANLTEGEVIIGVRVFDPMRFSAS
jgi:hypothetical protein